MNTDLKFNYIYKSCYDESYEYRYQSKTILTSEQLYLNDNIIELKSLDLYYVNIDMIKDLKIKNYTEKYYNVKIIFIDNSNIVLFYVTEKYCRNLKLKILVNIL